MLQIFHNPRCKISRFVLEELRKQNPKIEIIEYLKTKPTVKELKVLLIKLNLPVEKIIRNSEPVYKEKFKGKSFSEEEWLQILHENPFLIERPIVIQNKKAIICRPKEKVNDIIFEKL